MSDNRERDLVLAPNEYAFISDQTKGNIVSYVGPYKTSMANTDKPVFFNKQSKRFEICPLEESICSFTAAPEGWYVVLKNPSKDGSPPQVGTSNTLVPLNIGRKVNLPGPVFFALWPGQMAEVLEGHHLRSNEYLIVRVYEVEQARTNWNKAVITPQKTGGESEENKVLEGDIDVQELSMGQLLIIKGTEVSFYIPPTGIEVVRSQERSYVRKAVTLERLEYCILLDEDGNKRYITGPDVVFPKPTEQFIEKHGSRKFKAIELNENSGIYIKVIAPYEEDGKSYKVGEELFITGKEQMIYFPRPEHALIKYGEQEIYYAVAIPPGEGRYYLNRDTGKISLQEGPCMFLPDPREAVIVRRILSPKQVALWFPGNSEAIEYNRKLQEINNEQQARSAASPIRKRKAQDFIPMQDLQEQEQAQEELMGTSFTRKESHTKPRTITLNNKYEGAVTIDVWTGYAVLVTSKTGKRKVLVGPQTYLLQYDEVVQGIELSTGKPKNDDQLMRSSYLRVLNNKVSDIILAETGDFCEVKTHISYRVNFTGEPDRWFQVENYVKFLTDHLRSVIRNALKQQTVAEFYSNGMTFLRDMILGDKNEEGQRPGWTFAENGMQIYEVEIAQIELLDKEIQKLLFKAKHDELRQNIALAHRHKELSFTEENEKISQKIALAQSSTRKEQFALQQEEAAKRLDFDLAKAAADFQLLEKEWEALLKEQEKQLEISALKLEREKAAENMQLAFAQERLKQRVEELKAEVDATVAKAEAVSPNLIAALQAFGDKALAEKMAESMAPLSILGGKSVAEVFRNLLQGSVLEGVLAKKSEEPSEG